MSSLYVLFLTCLSICLPLLTLGQGGEVGNENLAIDCQDHRDNEKKDNGEYNIYPYPGDEEPPSNRKRVKTFCEDMANEDVWTVIQRHQHASEPLYFNKTWNLYKAGFGKRTSDFWIGNDALHKLTQGRRYILRVDIETWDTGIQRYAEYDEFHVASEEDNYRLHVDKYSGDAGDALRYHNGMQFSTFERDNDNYTNSCARSLLGGWWFRACAHSNLNGQSYTGKWTGADADFWGGVWWLPMHPTENNYEFYLKYSVKSVMKIRRNDEPARGAIAK